MHELRKSIFFASKFMTCNWQSHYTAILVRFLFATRRTAMREFEYAQANEYSNVCKLHNHNGRISCQWTLRIAASYDAKIEFMARIGPWIVSLATLTIVSNTKHALRTVFYRFFRTYLFCTKLDIFYSFIRILYFF